MLIQPNEQGWSTSTEGPWQLLFNDQYIIKLFETNIGTSTQEKLLRAQKKNAKQKYKNLICLWLHVIV